MFPWLAMGHLTPFLHLSNKLAERGYKVSFLLPTKTHTKFAPLNLYPDLISFIPLIVPRVHGLPLGAETMSDVPLPLSPLLLMSMDNMKNQVESALLTIMPDAVFYDFAYWVPAFTSRFRIKSIFCSVGSASAVSYFFGLGRKIEACQDVTEAENLMQPPSGYPSLSVQLRLFEARTAIGMSHALSGSITLYDRFMTSIKESDALCFRTCREIEGPFCDYIETQFGKPVFLSGPVLPELPSSQLEDRWVKWLGRFKEKSLVYCALGSECILGKDQFLELVLGLELTGLPFLAALKPPCGALTVEEALPEGFEERVRNRGVVHGDWVQQQLILGHFSVGCFMSHCGFGSMWESLFSECQIVLLPQSTDQFTNTRLMTEDLKVAVEIDRREDDGWFTRESVCNAVKSLMDKESEAANHIRANHTKWRNILSREGMESSYIDNFTAMLQGYLSLILLSRRYTDYMGSLILYHSKIRHKEEPPQVALLLVVVMELIDLCESSTCRDEMVEPISVMSKYWFFENLLHRRTKRSFLIQILIRSRDDYCEVRARRDRAATKEKVKSRSNDTTMEVSSSNCLLGTPSSQPCMSKKFALEETVTRGSSKSTRRAELNSVLPSQCTRKVQLKLWARAVASNMRQESWGTTHDKQCP
ncbi:hypothetical protein GIB67_039256 [Kingdonia uniflora]|uniref:Glycosyltransferase n=1 Tax=Kingdonia uniflora TaxID=39325 RepID=A0A7J7MLX1_9MAGN|nr:hypothetical protein GIB67_039256 [Kingdonia uniflora]